MANADVLPHQRDGTEPGLVAQFQHATGEARREAFCGLYERHAGGVHACLLRLTGSPHLAEDLTQETFLHALDGLDKFAGQSSFKTWVYQIAINLWADHRRKKRPVSNGELASRDAISDGPTPADLSEQAEEIDRLRRAIAEIPDELRAPLLLVRFEGMRYREAAEALGITLNAVRMRVHRAHLALTAKLSPQMGSGK
jgi:RNA polymerase sigma-70 factor (ECF subfamily)